MEASPVVGMVAVLLLFVACTRDGRGRGGVSEVAGSAVAPGGGEAPGAPAVSTAADPRVVPGKQEVATLAGGCFWGMEELLRQLPGVSSTSVGYTGGALPGATYADVKTGRTGHAEAVTVVFDPTQLSYERLLLEFFRIHDPTTVNQQGNDVGSQYRSAIFFHSEAQRRVAEEVKARVTASGAWSRPVVTEIVPAAPFYPAEDYHQDYLQKNPGGYTCHYRRPVTY